MRRMRWSQMCKWLPQWLQLSCSTSRTSRVKTVPSGQRKRMTSPPQVCLFPVCYSCRARHSSRLSAKCKDMAGVPLMKLSAIREQKANDKSPLGDGVHPPRNAEEAKALFWQGMRAMEARNDEAAFRIFDALSAYEGDAPPHLVATAKAGRDFLDPERTAEQKARTLFGFFSPTLIRVVPEGEG